MSDLGIFPAAWGWTALLLTLRLAPMVVVLPFFGGVAATPSVRAALVFVLLIALWPAGDLVEPASLLQGVHLAGSQFLLGLLSSLALVALSEVARTAGSIADTALGRGSFGAADPLGGSASGPLATFHALLFVALFFASGAHLLLISGVAWSLEVFALGQVLELETLQALSVSGLELTAAAFSTAVTLALPALAVGLIVDLGLGWVNRTLPQLPVLFLSMPLRMVLGWLTLAALLTLAADSLIAPVIEAFGSLFSGLFAGASSGPPVTPP